MITADLLQDGAISAGVLIVLLIPITWYGSVARRRDRQTRAPVQRQPVPVDTGPGPDPLLEYFGPQPANGTAPEPPRRPAPKFQPRPDLAGRSTLSSAFGSRPFLAAPPAAAGNSQAAPGPSAPERSAPGEAFGPGYGRPERRYPAGAGANGNGFGGPGGLGGPGSVGGPGGPGGSAPTLRHAPVSGSPPWGPAPRPTSELPWVMAPGPGQGVASPAPGAPVGQAPGGQVRNGQPDPAAAQPGPGPVDQPGFGQGRPGRRPNRSSAPRSIFDPEPGTFGRPENQGGLRPPGDSGSRPIYTWNPEEGESA